MDTKMKRQTLMVDRHLRITTQLQKDKAVRIEELSNSLGVSPNTIRRDLKALEEEGVLRRIQGGALLNENNQGLTTFDERLEKNLEAKKKIARKATSLIAPGDTIIIDSGTTMFELAKLLPPLSDLTVITNSIEIGNYLLAHKQQDMTLIISGGIALEGSRCLVGIPAENFFAQIHADTLFLAVRGITLQNGFTNQNLQEIPVKRRMITAAKKIVVLADNSKFGKSAISSICAIEDVQTLVTDGAMPSEFSEGLAKRGVTVIN